MRVHPMALGGAAGIVRGLGAFGGFVIPLVIGLLVKFSGPAGYPRGFSVFAGLSLLALIATSVLNRPEPAAGPAGNSDPAWPARLRR